MVFINLLSQLPLFPIRDPNDLVRKNQICLIVGIGLYLALSALIYFKKVPLADRLLSSIPDKRYLFLIVVVDLVLFVVIHRFQYGSFPSLSINSSEPTVAVQEQKEVDRRKQTPKEKVTIVNDNTSESINLDDDLESTFKRPGKLKQPNIHIKDQDTEYPLDFPDEASIPGRTYFKDDESQAVVDNWDVDDFTQEEYVPDRFEPNIDEFISN